MAGTKTTLFQTKKVPVSFRNRHFNIGCYNSFPEAIASGKLRQLLFHQYHLSCFHKISCFNSVDVYTTGYPLA